ncbi:MAG: adenylosuccinate lyase [Bacteroidota bacterium]
MKELFPLNAISPVDGRYSKQTALLGGYFSEKALIKYRIHVEIEYFIALCEIPLPQLKDFDKKLYPSLREIVSNFNDEDALAVKEIEKTTNHDVKAVEYFIKKHFDRLGLDSYKEFVHFGLTSQDINNTAQPLSIKEAHDEVMTEAMDELIMLLNDKIVEWAEVPMLARTHGQPASPTLLGKELNVFFERIVNQLAAFITIPFSSKFGGATGNFNAHHVAYPEIDWLVFADTFVNDTLGLERLQTTTQIEHYDNLAALFDCYKRINTILIDLCRDCWTYISMDYFKQQLKAGEIGSSAMPHKVNPIDFENAEGNFGIANAIFEHLSAKLPISRLQRDLTDSTVCRNIGVPFAHTLIGINSLIKGLNKLILNEDAINRDLDNNWAVVAEAIQTILRREAYPNPYEALKDLTRTNQKITKETMHLFIDGLQLPAKVKEELKQITPHNYVGIFKKQ